MNATTTTLIVRKDHLATARLLREPAAALRQGEVRVRIDRFALTANNITYAAFGDAMNYWQFFPTAQEGWGVVPVWGFGVVTESTHPDVALDERLYGYWPMADETVLSPTAVRADGFSDGAPRREGLHAVYNRYLYCRIDPLHSAGSEELQALLRPLFMTSWLIDDFLAEQAFFGADTVILSSASSKTAFGTAALLASRAGIEVIGLTSPRNKVFCESLGCYASVLGYEELELLPSDSSCVYVDFAGDAGLRLAIHTRLTRLRYSCSVGGTHVDKLGGAKNLPGPRATLFFAPAHSQKRAEEWGADVLVGKLQTAWTDFVAQVADPAAPWLVPDHYRGPEAALAAYQEVLGGLGHPRVGHIVSLDTP